MHLRSGKMHLAAGFGGAGLDGAADGAGAREVRPARRAGRRVAAEDAGAEDAERVALHVEALRVRPQRLGVPMQNFSYILLLDLNTAK